MIPGFNPWIGKIPWRRERLPTSVFWPGEFRGLYGLWSCKELDLTKQLSLHFIYSSVFYIDDHVIKQINLFLSKPNCCLIAVARTCRPRIVLDIKGEVFSLSPFSSVQSLSCVRLCDPMNHSTPGLPVHHQLPESTQTHAH